MRKLDAVRTTSRCSGLAAAAKDVVDALSGRKWEKLGE